MYFSPAAKVTVKHATHPIKTIGVKICEPNNTHFIPFSSDNINFATCSSSNVRISLKDPEPCKL